MFAYLSPILQAAMTLENGCCRITVNVGACSTIKARAHFAGRNFFCAIFPFEIERARAAVGVMKFVYVGTAGSVHARLVFAACTCKVTGIQLKCVFRNMALSEWKRCQKQDAFRNRMLSESSAFKNKTFSET